MSRQIKQTEPVQAPISVCAAVQAAHSGCASGSEAAVREEGHIPASSEEKEQAAGMQEKGGQRRLGCRIKDLPEYCRPYEKCERYGAEALSNAELLAVVLQTGYYSERDKVNKSALVLAEELLCQGGGELGLLSLRHGTPETFRQVEGIGRSKAVRLACVAELAARLWQEQQLRRLDLKSPETVAAYYREELRHLNQERVCIMLLDGRDNFLMSLVISQGSVNLSVLSPREIFYQALIHRAASFVLVHNHPSGDASPSAQDRCFTEALHALRYMMNVPLRDSLIVADAGYYSFLEAGELRPSRSVNG